jgi:hypothetical protein
MKIRRLTPSILKKIIAEEKKKLNIQKSKSRKTTVSTTLIDRKVNELTKLALMEAKQRIKIKKIQKIRELIKKSLK